MSFIKYESYQNGQSITNYLYPVYHCESCGMISTVKKEYVTFKGILICVGCKNDYDNKDENVTRWIDTAICNKHKPTILNQRNEDEKPIHFNNKGTW